MKDFTLTSEYLNLLDVFCYKLSLAEPDKSFGKDVENADVVPIKITPKEVSNISLSAIMRLDDFFKETGLKVYDEPFPDVESELEATYYHWLSVRPNWFSSWYAKYQKIRFYRFGQLRTDELTAIAATVQIMRITTEQYNKFRENWTKQKEEYEGKLARISKADKEYYITASYLLELASRSYELFLGSEPEQKRQIITLTLQNLTLKEGNLCYDWVKPFDSIFVSAKSHKWGG